MMKIRWLLEYHGLRLSSSSAFGVSGKASWVGMTVKELNTMVSRLPESGLKGCLLAMADVARALDDGVEGEDLVITISTVKRAG